MLQRTIMLSSRRSHARGSRASPKHVKDARCDAGLSICAGGMQECVGFG